MIKNVGIGFCAVGDKHINYGKKLAGSLSKIVEQDIYVLTDKPNEFSSINNVSTINHVGEFSYHDKVIIFEQAFKNTNTVICIDADIELQYIEDKDIDFAYIDDGFYPEFVFEDDRTCSMKSLISGNHDSITYGKEFFEFCLKSNYDTDTKHFQESFMCLKENDTSKIKSFIDIWKNMAVFCNKQDKLRNYHLLGYGEGYGISIALRNSNIVMHEHEKPSQITQFKNMLKHLKWHKDD